MKRIYIPLPDEEARSDLVTRLLAGQQQDDEMQNNLTVRCLQTGFASSACLTYVRFTLTMQEDDVRSIVLRSAGYSGADMCDF